MKSRSLRRGWQVWRAWPTLCLMWLAAGVAMAAPLPLNELLADHAGVLTATQREENIASLKYLSQSSPFQFGIVTVAGMPPEGLPAYAANALAAWRPDGAANALLFVVETRSRHAQFAVGEALRARFPSDLMLRAIARRVQPYLDDGNFYLALDRARMTVIDLKDGHVPADLLPPPEAPSRPLYQRIAPGGPVMLFWIFVGLIALPFVLIWRFMPKLPMAFACSGVGIVIGLVAGLLQIPKPFPLLIALAIGFWPLTRPADAQGGRFRWRARAGVDAAASSGVGGSSARTAPATPVRVLSHLLRGRMPWSPRYSRSVVGRIGAHIAQLAPGHSGVIAFSALARLPLREVLRGQGTGERARAEFVANRLWDTPGSNAVLIQVVAADRRLEIVADRGIAQLVPAERWDAIRTEAEAALARGEFERAAEVAVDAAATLLREAFPR